MQENENEKKKVGFFGKIKNILFVDDETVDDKEAPVLPDYKNKPEEIKEEIKEVKEEPQVIGSRLNNERKEFEDEEEIEVEEEKEEEVKEEVKEEKESPFFSFDEDEFKRLTSRVARSEAINKENDSIVMPAIKSNYNIPNNTPKYESRSTTLSSVNNTAHPGRKPFVPSPVISPVYGILDKNYSKEDIVDRRTERKPKDMDNLDRVRTKAFGDNNKEEKKDIKVEEVKEEKIEIKERIVPTIDELPKRDEKIVTREERKKVEEVNNKAEEINNKVEEVEDNVEIDLPTLDNKVIDSIDEKFSSPIEEELNNMINTDEEEDLVDEEETNGTKKPAKLDDLEKTSTLKILDDIEKELNSIKPLNSEKNDDEEADKSDDTVEKDIFDMISSMYEGGDEEDDSD